MSQSYRICLTPLEDYFFGNERTFRYGDRNPSIGGDYFVVSERYPSQTTLFGVLRYLMLEKRTSDYRLSQEDIRRIGESSFYYQEGATFGLIESISPLYFFKDQVHYIPVPKDHYGREDYYCPMTLDESNLPENFSGKHYHTDYLVAVSGDKGQIGTLIPYNTVFQSVTRIGINRKAEVDGFFKKQYWNLQGFQFVYYAKLKEPISFTPCPVVCMGYGKSAFGVTIEAVDAFFTPKELSALISRDTYVAVSDLYVTEQELLQLTDSCRYKITDFREVRGFRTNYSGGTGSHRQRYQKSETLYRLISAGSVFKCHPDKNIEIHNCANVAGMNVIVKGESK